MSATAVILAAGAGHRLGNYGGATSKAMVRVLDRPLILWVTEGLRRADVDRVVVVAHVDNEPLRRLVRDSIPSATLVTQRERLGIADAIVQALPALDGDGGYLACACDSLFAAEDIQRVIDAGQLHREGAVVGVQDMGIEATATRSAVELEGDRVRRIIEKPPPGTTSSPLVALPLYWLPAAVAPYLRDAAAVGGERHVTTALSQFIAAGGGVRAVRVGRRIEITAPEDVATAEDLLRH